MVWAISHDTKDGKYNRALARVANRKVSALPIKDGLGDAYEHFDALNEQCKWTNCGEGCPGGWVHIKRSDGGARKNEYMWDKTGCDGLGSHSFCCPAQQDKPTCG